MEAEHAHMAQCPLLCHKCVWNQMEGKKKRGLCLKITTTWAKLLTLIIEYDKADYPSWNSGHRTNHSLECSNQDSPVTTKPQCLKCFHLYENFSRVLQKNTFGMIKYTLQDEFLWLKLFGMGDAFTIYKQVKKQNMCWTLEWWQ